MPSYKAPLDDIRFVLNEVLRASELTSYEGYEMADNDTINQILDEGAKLAENVMAPLNQVGDTEGCTYDPETGDVKTPTGFKNAYKAFKDGFWTGLGSDPEYGGMGMPHVIDTVIKEIFCSANMSLAMYPGLSHGAYQALQAFGTDEQKDTVLPKLISGEWSGTMCLTEPGCGTDLGLMKTKAVPQADGTYKITGEKIFISAGEHDLTDNIVHLVLAKIDDKDLPEDQKTPEGIKGVSLFLVSKYDLDDNGEPADRNDVKCGGLEEKMGIHGNATCVMRFDGAKAQLIGEPHKGMRAMFVMMNEARLGVGMQAQGLAEVSYQNAEEYAQNRLQGKSFTGQKEKASNDQADPLIVHPDIRRELMTMKSVIEGQRMMSAWVAMYQDIAKKDKDEAKRQNAEDMLAIMTPIVKAHFSDNAETITSSGMQIFGGHGFIEEYGMAQFSRDARITRIYEGANGIQALDLIGRKAFNPKKPLIGTYIKAVEADIKAAKKNGAPKDFIKATEKALEKLKWTNRRLKYQAFRNRKDKGKIAELMAAASTDYLRMMSLVSMSHMWLKMADTASSQLKADAPNKEFYETKLETGRFYNAKVLPQIHTLSKTIAAGPKTLMEVSAEKFTRTQGTVAEKTLPRGKPKKTPKK